MADLNERSALSSSLKARTKVALAAALTDLLREPDTGTDDERKRRRIKQRWALSAIDSIDRVTDRVALMIASKAPDAQISSGGQLDDAELVNLVGVALDAIAGVELRVPTETLPV